MKKNDENYEKIFRDLRKIKLEINFIDIKNKDFSIFKNKDLKLSSDRNFIIDCLKNI